MSEEKQEWFVAERARALAMVALRRGARVSVAELRQQVTPGPEGLTLQQLRQLAAAVGLPCQSGQVSAARLGEVSLPVIAHLSDGHYVVLHEVSPGGVVVGDPATGIATWSVERLSRYYSGVLLLFDGTHPSPPNRAAADCATPRASVRFSSIRRMRVRVSVAPCSRSASRRHARVASRRPS